MVSSGVRTKASKIEFLWNVKRQDVLSSCAREGAFSFLDMVMLVWKLGRPWNDWQRGLEKKNKDLVLRMCGLVQWMVKSEMLNVQTAGSNMQQLA